MRDDRTHTVYSLPSSNHSLMPSAMSSEARIMTSVDCSHGPVGFTSLAHCQTTIAPSIPSGEISQHGMPMMSTHHATNTAFGGALTTEVTNSHENYPSVIRNTDSHPHLSNVRTTDVQKPATNTLCAKTCAKSHNVRLPAFAGNFTDSWKVWHAHFTTIADLNQWDKTTRLTELMQRLQGTAAEFVFDEIPQEMLTNYDSLVSELDSRFKSVETNRTFKVQFSKRLQNYDETVEDYAAELKRLYDKAYPGRNPEMRRQLLMQQFLNGLRDKNAKFAVEYYKEPISIEEAIHHVVIYLEAQQGPKGDGGHRRKSRGKSVRFDDDDADHDDEGDYDSHDENYDTAVRSRSAFPFPSRNRQTLRKVNKNTQNTPSNQSREQSPAITEEKDILQKILSFMEKSDNNAQQNKLPQPQDKRGQGYAANQGQLLTNATQGQGQNLGQSQNQGQGRHANLQCFHCSERGQ